MYLSDTEQLSGIFSKLKKAVEKIVPRELSPIRMIKRSQQQKATVNALKTQVSEAERATGNAQAEAETAKQVAQITSQALAIPQTSAALPSLTAQLVATEPYAVFAPAGAATAQPVAQTVAPPAEDRTSLYVGIAALTFLGIFLLKGKHK